MAAAAKLQRALLLLLFSCALVTPSKSRSGPPAVQNGRQLLQSGVSCPSQIPACMPRRCTSRILGNRETYVCLRCMPTYVPVKGSDGKSVVQCVCPAGTYQVGAGSSRRCEQCDIGRFCPGGDLKARRPTDNIGGTAKDCNPEGKRGLTTKFKKSSKPTDCVAEAGYVLPRVLGNAAVECPASTYSPSQNRLKSCLLCQSGLVEPPDFIAKGGVRKSKEDVCKLPPGKFWELNVVRDCPQGLYREGFVNVTDPAAISCLSCPEGWTTDGIGKTSLAECNRLQPGRKVTTVPPGSEPSLAQDVSTLFGSETESCPFGYYYNGTLGFFGCQPCPWGSTTQIEGATKIDDCLVPPGYYIQSLDGGITGQLAKCPNNITKGENPPTGYYRANWVAPSSVIDTDGATACTACGVGVLSRPLQTDERYDLAQLQDDGSDPYFGYVASASFSCYILQGWGITFDLDDFSKMRAIIPCPENTYGVAKETFGLVLAPCKACTKNLRSPAGSSSFDACKNPAGFGYSSEGANQCPDGFWAEADSMAPCEQCPEGRTTDYIPGDGSYQSSINSCKVLPGYGVYAATAANAWAPSPAVSTMNARPCPVGWYSPGDGPGVNGTLNPICQECPGLQSTKDEGSITCDVCKAGAGGSAGNCQPCPYNTFQQGAVLGDGLTCNTCPSTAFNHYTGETFVSYGVTFWSGLATPYLCVPRFSQAARPAGHTLGLTDEVFETVPAKTTVRDCVQACPVDMCCIAEMVYSEDDGSMLCRHAKLPPARPMALVKSLSGGSSLLYYKLPPSQLIAAASINDTSSSSNSELVAAASVYTVMNSTERVAGCTSAVPAECEDTKVQAKTQASGVFAVCDMSGWTQYAVDGWIGTSPNPALVEEPRSVMEWDVPGVCDSEITCHRSCMIDSSCWGFIFVPGHGFTLRTGEMVLGVRSFFVSPDPAQAPKTVSGLSAVDAAALSDDDDLSSM